MYCKYMSVVCMRKFGDVVEVACDSQGTRGDLKSEVCKFFYKDGWFVACAGSLSIMNFLKEHITWSDIDELNYHSKITSSMLEFKEKFFKDEDAWSISFLATDGNLCIYGDCHFQVSLFDDYECIGSGAGISYPSVDAGLVAQGCEDACKFDYGCGLPINHFVFDNQDRMAYNLVYTTEEIDQKIPMDGMMGDFYKIVKEKGGRSG